MCLVNDDETDVVQRHEERGAGSDNDVWCRCGQGFLPGGVPLCFGLTGMGQNDVFEMMRKLIDELRSQGDLGHKNDHGSARGKHVLRALNIYGRLAGTGDAMEE